MRTTLRIIKTSCFPKGSEISTTLDKFPFAEADKIFSQPNPTKIKNSSMVIKSNLVFLFE